MSVGRIIVEVRNVKMIMIVMSCFNNYPSKGGGESGWALIRVVVFGDGIPRVSLVS